MIKVKKLSIILVFFFAFLLLGVKVWAGEDKEEKKSTLLTSISQRIERLQKKSSPRVSTVAGLRGTKKDTGVEPYWKGKKGKGISEKEIVALKKGIDLAQEGKNEEAKAELESFVKAHPKSKLVPDARKVISILKEEQD